MGDDAHVELAAAAETQTRRPAPSDTQGNARIKAACSAFRLVEPSMTGGSVIMVASAIACSGREEYEWGSPPASNDVHRRAHRRDSEQPAG
jgi:hypothetical protein